ncbi:MAG: HAMP domain-containing sensor histidine kinase [Ilumatobacteraceae bacterium]
MLKLSLRARVLTGMAAVLVALGIVAYIVTVTTRSHLLDQVDAQLEAAGGFGRDEAPRLPSGGPPSQNGNAAPPDRPSNLYVGVIRRGELVTYFGTDLSGVERAVPAIDAAAASDAAESGDPVTVGAVGDADLRYRVRVVEDQSGDLVVTGLPLSDVDDAVSRLILVEVVGTAVIVAVLGAVTWSIVRLGIRPIKQMTLAAERIADGDRAERVPEAAPSSEAGQLGAALNHMLGRLDDAFEQRAASEDRLRRFVADASHELRTPVTTIRGYAELYRVGGLRDDDDLDEAMRRTEQEAVRMSRLVDDLINLAKLDEGRPLERRAVDLSLLAADAARDAAAVDPQRSISTDLPVPAVVLGGEDRLRQVIANVVGNALVHTPAGTPIDVRVAIAGPDARLAVTDHGPGMPADVAAKVTQRFYRADPARARNRGGSGLGMSIADAAVTAHGGTITVDSELGRGTTVTVALPLQVAPPAARPQSA